MILPPVEELQCDPDTRWKWVKYSALDAKSTLELYKALRSRLEAMQVQLDGGVADDYSLGAVRVDTMWDVYCHFWRPFGELLTDMEAAGMAVDRCGCGGRGAGLLPADGSAVRPPPPPPPPPVATAAACADTTAVPRTLRVHLAAAQQQAERDQQQAQETFRRWAMHRVPDAKYMNVGSGPQVLQLLFGGARNKNAEKQPVPLERIFKVPNQLGLQPGQKRAKKMMEITLHK